MDLKRQYLPSQNRVHQRQVYEDLGRRRLAGERKPKCSSWKPTKNQKEPKQHQKEAKRKPKRICSLVERFQVWTRRTAGQLAIFWVAFGRGPYIHSFFWSDTSPFDSTYRLLFWGGELFFCRGVRRKGKFPPDDEETWGPRRDEVEQARARPAHCTYHPPVSSCPKQRID